MEYILMLLKSLLMILLCHSISCLPSNRTPKSGNDLNKKEGQKNYLAQYGYFGGNDAQTGSDNKPTEVVESDKEFNKAIRRFQRTWHLNETGVVDEKTLSLMQSKRCGNTDKGMIQIIKRTKRFKLNIAWRKRSLTYRIRNRTPDLSSSLVDQTMARAFDEWAKVSALTFRRVYSYSDIDILFASYYHGDGIPFDGRRGSLAHAFFPVSGGDVHFDESEYWTLNTGGGTDLFQIAVHEIGHSLGLGHSNQYGAVMWPYYSYQRNFALSSDDIRGIQALYGRQTQSTTTPNPNTPTTTTTTNTGTTTSTGSTSSGPTTSSTSSGPTTTFNPFDPAGFCSNSNIDAISTDIFGRIFVFKGEYYALLSMTQNRIAPGFPKLIRDNLPDIPSNIDGAVYIPEYDRKCYYSPMYNMYRCWRVKIDSGGTYIFKNDTFYRYLNGFKESGLITSRFPGMPTYIDAAYTLEQDKLYFIKGDQLWRMTISRKSVDAGYPKSLPATATGLPSKIDAVFQAPHQFYVLRYYFSGNQYYRITGLSSNTVDVSSTPYPRPIGKWWFGCPVATSSEASSIHQVEFEINKDTIVKPDDLFIDEKGNVINLNKAKVIWEENEDTASVASIVDLSRFVQISLIIVTYMINLF